MALNLSGTSGITGAGIGTIGPSGANVTGVVTCTSIVSSGAVSGTTGTFTGAVSGTTGTFTDTATFSGGLVHITSATAPSIRLQDTNNANSDFKIYSPDGTNALRIYHQNTTSDLLSITSSGAVGIKTVTPTFAAGSGIQLRGSGSDFTSYRVSAGGKTGVDFSQGSTGHGYLYNRDNSDVIFGTNNTERFRIKADGTHTICNPMVFAYAPASTQALTDATWTKNTWLTSEDIDTDGAFASSTFTVPANKGGTYYVSAGNNLYGNDNNIRNARTAIYKNGTIYARAHQIVMSTASSDLRHMQCITSCILTLAAGDTIENYMYLDVNSGLLYMSSDNDTVRANFLMVYKIG